MTLNQLVSYISDEVSQSSPEAIARIGRSVNKRYKQVTSSIGMITSRREEVSKAATVGNRYITFTGIEKLDTVFRRSGDTNIILDEITNDEMLDLTPRDEPPTKYSIFSVSPTSVTLFLDCTPSTPFTLYAHGLADTTTLSGTDSPALPESFHDVLIWGAIADEWRRKEKKDLARDAEAAFVQRLSDLRMFIAKSAYLDIHRGKNATADGWWDTSNHK